MDVLVFEDESAASDRLINLLSEVDPLINVTKVITTVSDAKIALRSIEADLIFMDIHLSDGISFSIFESVEVTIPIIFTTSHDEYALEAFRVNSIDYLLKPISKQDLIRAVDKFNQLKIKQIDFNKLNRSLQKATYHKRFMVTAKDRIITIKADEVAYFYAQGKLVYLYRLDGTRHLIDFTLQHLENILDPDHFFRINRQFIIHLEAIKEMFTFSRSRIKISLYPKAPESAIVSSERASTFKKWLNK